MGSIEETRTDLPSVSVNGEPNESYNGTINGSANGIDSHATQGSITIPMHNVPAFTPSKRLRVVTIGAGYSGMMLAHKLQYTYAKEFATLVEHTIFESKSEVGGTWGKSSLPSTLVRLLAELRFLRCFLIAIS